MLLVTLQPAGLSALLALVWLIRQPLGIQQYSVIMLLTGFGLYLLGRILRTETSSGEIPCNTIINIHCRNVLPRAAATPVVADACYPLSDGRPSIRDAYIGS